MARVVLYLLIAVLCVDYSSAHCSKKIIQKIHELKGLNAFSNFIDGVAGKKGIYSYRFDYIDVGRPIEVSRHFIGCISATFYRAVNNRVLVKYDGLLDGVYRLRYNHGAVEHVDDHGIGYARSYVVSAVNGVYAIYTCYVTKHLNSIAAVIVPRNARGRSSTAAVNASKDLVKKLGFTLGNTFKPCPVKK